MFKSSYFEEMQCRHTTLARGIEWSRAVLCQVSLTFKVMHKVVLRFWGDATEKMQMYPLVETSGGQEQYYTLGQLYICLPISHFMFSCCRGKSYIGIWIGDISSWTLSNLCILLSVVVVAAAVVIVVTVSCCCCSSVIVDLQLQINSNNNNNKITQ